MPDQLFPWQMPIADTVEKSLRERKLHILATCTGSGKMYITADVIRRLQRPALIICPKAVITQTHRCMESMGSRDLVLDVINPQQLIAGKNCRWYDSRTLWHIPPETLVCWDEIHRGASGIKSKTTLACAQLKAFGASLLATSATVACSPLQLRALGYHAGLHGFDPATYYKWCHDNGVRDVLVQNRMVHKFTNNKTEATRIMKSIRASFGIAFQGLSADQIEGFPAEVIELTYINVSARDREEIDESYATMSERMKRIGKTDLAEMMRERERIEYALAPAIAELVMDSVEDGLSPVVFWNFTSSRERFEQMLKDKGVTGIASVHGTQSEAERQRGIDRFNDNEVFIASFNTSAGGCGISAHDVKHERQRVSYLVPSFNAAECRQALGRIRRVGGTAVVQKFVIASGTLMELVAVSLNRKLTCIDLLNDNDLTV
jgi:hypothetical protein